MIHKNLFLMIMACSISSSIIAAQKEVSDPKGSRQEVEKINKSRSEISTILWRNQKKAGNDGRLSSDTLTSIRSLVPIFRALQHRDDTTVNDFVKQSSTASSPLTKEVVNVLTIVNSKRTTETIRAAGEALAVLAQAEMNDSQRAASRGRSKSPAPTPRGRPRSPAPQAKLTPPQTPAQLMLYGASGAANVSGSNKAPVPFFSKQRRAASASRTLARARSPRRPVQAPLIVAAPLVAPVTQ